MYYLRMFVNFGIVPGPARKGAKKSLVKNETRQIFELLLNEPRQKVDSIKSDFRFSFRTVKNHERRGIELVCD